MQIKTCGLHIVLVKPSIHTSTFVDEKSKEKEKRRERRERNRLLMGTIYLFRPCGVYKASSKLFTEFVRSESEFAVHDIFRIPQVRVVSSFAYFSYFFFRHCRRGINNGVGV